MRRPKALIFIILGAVTLLFLAFDMTVGGAPVPLGDVLAALTGGDVPKTTARIVVDIRLVKAVVALLAGAALGVSGLEMQTLFRNPLAGPFLA